MHIWQRVEEESRPYLEPTLRSAMLGDHDGAAGALPAPVSTIDLGWSRKNTPSSSALSAPCSVPYAEYPRCAVVARQVYLPHAVDDGEHSAGHPDANGVRPPDVRV